MHFDSRNYQIRWCAVAGRDRGKLSTQDRKASRSVLGIFNTYLLGRA